MKNFSPSLSEMFRSFFRNKELIYSLTKREIVARYRGSVLGLFWSFIYPVIMLTIYTFVFSVVFKARWNVGGDSKSEFALILFAGFNPEFTGRENIYMQGIILGLTKKQIDACLDAILTFADIGDFVDKPVKIYSSGMYVRLAFSVIVHVDADILVIDEALAVGDAFFQAKCTRILQSMIKKGVTIIFVSHDTGAVKSLCQKALFLSSGNNIFFGEVTTAVERYYSSLVRKGYLKPETELLESPPSRMQYASELIADNRNFLEEASFQRIQNGAAEFLNVMVLNSKKERITMAEFGQEIIIRQILRVNTDVPAPALAYHIRNKNGIDIIYSDTGLEGDLHIMCPQPGSVYLVDWHVSSTLREGDYIISSMISEPINLSLGQVNVVDFIPLSCKISFFRGDYLPIYGAIWQQSSPNITIVERDTLTC